MASMKANSCRRCLVAALFFFFYYLSLEGDKIVSAATLSYKVDGSAQVEVAENEALFSVRPNQTGGVSVVVDSCPEWWYFNFSPPEGEKLSVGTYLGAQSFRYDPLSPGLDVFTFNYFGNELGDFVVLDLSYGDKGEILSFAVDLTQYDEQSVSGIQAMIRWSESIDPICTGCSIIDDSHPVPIPGAVWLLGAGMAGIVGIRKNFNS